MLGHLVEKVCQPVKTWLERAAIGSRMSGFALGVAGALFASAAAMAQPTAAYSVTPAEAPDIGPGELADVTISVFNVTSPYGTISDLSFTLDVDAGLSGARRVVGTTTFGFGCAAGAAVAGSSFVTFSSIGMSVFQSCEISFQVAIPADATIGTYTFSPSDMSGTDSAAGAFVYSPGTFDIVVELDDDGPASAFSGPSGPVYGDFNVSLSWTDGGVAEIINGFAASDVVASNATVALVDAGGDAPGGDGVSSVLLAVTPTGGTPITLDLPGGVVTDAAGNDNLAASQYTVIYGGAVNPTDEVDISMAFQTNPVDVGENTTLRFTIANNSAADLTAGSLSINFDSHISGALAVAPAAALSCGGSSVATLASANRVLQLSGIELLAGQSCSFDQVVSIPGGAAAATYGFATSAPTYMLGGSFYTDDPAADFLTLALAEGGEGAVTFGAEFQSDEIVAGGTVDVEYTIAATADFSVSSIGFTEDYDAALSGLVATGLPAGDVCGAGSTLSGTSALTLTGGSLGVGGVCRFTVTLSVPASAPAATYGNSASVLSFTRSDTGADTQALSGDTFDVRSNLPVAPTVVISGSTADLGVGVSRELEIRFSKTVDGLVLGDFVSSNATLTSLAGDGVTFALSLSPIAPGAVSVEVPAAAAQDGDGIDNLVSNTFAFTAVTGAPEISVTGNGVSITDGATSASDSNFTSFLSADVAAGTSSRTFSVTNAGDGNLVVSSVAISGANAADFSVTASPVGTVAPGGSASLTITFDPSAIGVRNATMTINSDDADEAAFDFLISGEGAAAPEIAVASASGATAIVSGSVLTSTAAGTDFGTVNIDGGVATSTFLISNTGGQVLNLGAGAVSVASDGGYSVSAQPSASVPSAGSTTFTIQFDPSSAATQNAVVSIANDDADESPYTFALTGVGLDNQAPTGQSVAFDAALYGPSTSGSLSFTIDDPEIGASYTYSVTSSGGAGSVTGSGTIPVPSAGAPSERQITGVDVSGLPDGTLTVSVVLTDESSNAAPAVTNTAVLDQTGPTVGLATGSADPVSGAFTLTATFSEGVTGFALGDLSVSNGVASAFSATSASVYTATITPTANGAVTVDVATAVAQDAAGNSNSAAPQFSIENDETVPTVVLATGSADPVSGAFTVTATFSEDVTGFALGDFSVGNGTASGFSATSAAVYTAIITPAADGAVTVDIASGAAQDAAGNDNAAATQFSIENDETAPTVALASGSADPVSGAFTITATFSEDVTGFGLGDLTVGNGSASSFSATSATVYTATITPSADGTVTVDVAGGAAQDDAGNASSAAIQFSIENDQTGPSVVLSTGSLDPVSGAFTVTATFSESVTGFALGDFSVSNGAASGFSAISATVYSAIITPASDGAVTVDVAGSVAQDSAGNGNAAASQFTIESDETSPTVVLSTGSTDPVSGAFTITATFSEDVTGFAVGDFTVGNGTASAFSATSATVYTATITPAADGAVTIDVPAAAAQDAAGNNNTAATQFSIENDGTAPSATITSSVSDPVSGAFSVTLTFSESVTGATISGFQISNGVAANFAGSGTVYTADVTPTADGLVTVSYLADNAVDAAGNGNTVSNAFSVTSDSTNPGLTISTSSSDPVSGAFTASFAFSEAVTGFGLDDISVGNGTASAFSASSAAAYTASITPAADGTVTLDVASAAAQDAAGNASTAAAQFTIVNDETAPTVALSGPTVDQVGVFTLSIAFSEDVTGLALADLVVGNGSAANLAGSGSAYTVEITPAATGSVTVDLAANLTQDAAGNGNAAATQFAVGADLNLPALDALIVSNADLRIEDVGTSFTVAATFSEAMDPSREPVFAFTPDVAATLSLTSGAFTSGDTVYTATYTVIDAGQVAADVDVSVTGAADAAGNALPESTRTDLFSVEMRRGSVSVAVAITGATDGSFGFGGDFGDFVVATTNQAGATSFDDIAEGVYSLASVATDGFNLDAIACTGGATVIDVASGTVTITLEPTDSVSCEFTQIAEPDVDETEIPTVSIELPTLTDDPASATTSFELQNVGGEAFFFTASTDQPWLVIDPTSGSIPATGSLEFTVSFTAAVLDLEPGSYNATITVIEVGPSGQRGGTSKANALETISIPVEISIEPRLGSLTVITSTSDPNEGEGSFSFASSLAALDGQAVTTAGGSASITVSDVLRGSYTVTQLASEGWDLAALSCTGDSDGGNVYDLANGQVTVDLDAEESMVCTFTNRRNEDYIRGVTLSAIRNFMATRADLILTNSPRLSSRMRSDRTSAMPNRFMADFRDGRLQAQMSTSLSALRQATESSEPQQPGSERFSLNGRTGASSLDVWMQASVSNVSDNRAGLSSDADFAIVHVGSDIMISDHVLAGVLVQYDQTEMTTGDWGSVVEGDGWMVGPYVVAQLSEATYFDLRAAWGQSDNTVNPIGTYIDSFETDRWMVEANLSGDIHHGGWRITPGIGLAYFNESQGSYTDTLGIFIPGQTVTIGRVTAGPELAYRFENAEGGYIEPYLNLTALYDYNDADVFNAAGSLQTLGHLRGDARLGLTVEMSNGGRISGEVSMIGLGEGDFEANNAMLRIRLPLSMH